MSPAEFIAKISPAALDSSKRTGIPAAFTIAEAALESGWGKSGLTDKANNLFGVKASLTWRGPTVSIPTREWFRGAWVVVPAMWRAYPSWLAAIDDHAQFLLKNPRYHAAFSVESDAEAFAHAVADAGYATDPNYAGKIISVMHAHNLENLA